MHEHAILLNIGLALGVGLLGGLLARLARLPTLIGYLVAGIVVGPHTPGLLASGAAVQPVANLGVILLMFAIGVQFSLEELASVQKTALIAGGIQIGGTILIGIGLGILFGWGIYGGLFFGCALALSSTAVAMRILEERGEVGTGHGSIILGIAVVQDLSLVVMAAVLPALSSLFQQGSAALATLGTALLTAGIFVAAALILAVRVVPMLLGVVARTGSRELFVLAVIVICIGAAVTAEIAGLGLPLGAFLAGMVISESEYAHEVFSQVRPLRDVFAALFFVSIGMLLDPSFLAAQWPVILAVVVAIVLGKCLVTALPIYALGWHGRVALISGLGLAQIGEFSFVLASVGAARGLISPEISGVLLTSALISILLTPFLFQGADPFYNWMNQIPSLSTMVNRGARGVIRAAHKDQGEPRVIVVGYGRVGRYVSDALVTRAVPHLVIEYDAQAAARCRRNGVPVLFGDASSPTVLQAARPERAELAVVALPDAGTTELAIRKLKAQAPGIQVVARVHRGDFIAKIRAAGADAVIHAEFEAGTEMIRQGLERLGFEYEDIEGYLEGVRLHRYRESVI